MRRISVPAAALRDPAESEEVLVGFEDALFSDGSECRCTPFSEDGELELLPPHWHIIERGRQPDAGPLIHPIWGKPPA